MPSYRGVTVRLQSQYDIKTIPEYPFSSISDPSQGPSTKSSASSILLSPLSIESGRSDCNESSFQEVYSAIYPASQFWISYTITPPTQIQDRDRQLKFMYFKLFMNDRCVTSWGGGADNAWKGKTMWSLVDGGTDYKGRQQVERRALFFTKQGDDTGKKCEQGTFEIRIFRSIGRMRVAKEVHQFDERCKEGSAVDFVNFGQAKRKEPQRFYRYALMDPIDEPYATFRYHLRTQDQLDALNLGMRTSKDTFVSAVEEMNVDKASFSPLQVSASTTPSEQDSVIYNPYVHSSLESARCFTSPPPQHQKPLPPSPPPSLSPPFKFTAAGEHAFPQRAPHKKQYEDGPREWIVRTPSPVNPDRNRFRSPPLEKKKKASRGGMLRNVLNSALRRKGRG